MLNTMKIIWLGLFFYPIVIVFVAFKVLTPAEVKESPLELIFQLLAIVLLIASHVLPKLVNKRYEQLVKEKNTYATLKAYFSGYIISLAHSDAVIILGFVLVTQTHEPKKILPFLLAGILNLLHFFPRRDKILRTAKSIT